MTPKRRALRGQGYPHNVTAYDSTAYQSRAQAEIHCLAEAHRSLLERTSAPVQVSRTERLENFLSNHRGILSVIAIMVAIILGLLKIFIG